MKTKKMQSKILQTTMDIIFWEFLLLYQIFFSPQVQRSVIISTKHGIYPLLEKLPNDLRLRILRNQERSRNLETSYCQWQRHAVKPPPRLSHHAHNVYTGQKEISHEKENCNHICTQHLHEKIKFLQ